MKVSVEFDSVRDIAAKKLSAFMPSERTVDKVALEVTEMLWMLCEMDCIANGEDVPDETYADERVVHCMVRRIYRIYKDGVVDARDAMSRASIALF